MKPRYACPLVTAGVALILAANLLAQTPPSSKPPGSRPSSKAKAVPAEPPPSPAFLETSKAASAAREANHLDEAIALYLKAVNLRPSWVEGWWYLGTMSYELDRYEQARDAFRRVVLRNPQNAAAWAFIGLSEFQLKDYDAALTDLLRARTFGVAAHRDLAHAVRYHAAILLTRNTQYEQATQLLSEFAVEGNDTPRVIEALGLAALNLPVLPAEAPGEKRDLVMMAGRAQYFSAARMLPTAKQGFEQLALRYPETPNVHYAYGVFLLGEEPDLGVAELEKELKITPNHAGAMLQLTFEYIKRSEYETAKSWAERAVTAEPTSFVARKALGQVLLEIGDTDGAIRELEAGVELARDSPALRFQLAKAYQKAGRAADAERERAEFVKLDRMVRASRTGSQALGGVEPDSSAPPENQNPQR
jgi:tetratricopeptide (TPR) repeat protein